MIVCVTFKDEKGVLRVSHGVNDEDRTVILSTDRMSDIGAVFSSEMGEWVLLEKADKIFVFRNIREALGLESIDNGEFDLLALREYTETALQSMVLNAKAKNWAVVSRKPCSKTGFPMAIMIKPSGTANSDRNHPAVTD